MTERINQYRMDFRLNKHCSAALGIVMLDVLHWLPVRQRIQYRVVSLVWRCQLGLAPAYLRDLCRPVSGIQGSRSLRSAERGVLVVTGPVCPYSVHEEPRILCGGP